VSIVGVVISWVEHHHTRVWRVAGWLLLAFAGSPVNESRPTSFIRTAAVASFLLLLLLEIKGVGLVSLGGEGHGHDQLKYFNGAQRKKK
jgi:hypothetical protein